MPHDHAIRTSALTAPLVTSSETLVDVLRRRGREQPDQLVYTFLVDGEQREQRATFGSVERRARAVARLIARHAPNAGVGERVLLLYPPALEYIYAFYGCLCAGAIAVPATSPGPSRVSGAWARLCAIAADSRPTLVLTTASVLELLPKLTPTMPELASLTWLATDELAEAEAEPSRNLDFAPAPEQLAFLQYTSGSTATPKGVMVSHANIMSNQAMIAQGFGSSVADVGVGWLPFYHDMGLIGNVLHPMFVGYPFVLMSPLSFLKRPLRWLQAVSRYRASISGGPNFAFELCIERSSPEERALLDLSCWTLAFNGAEPIRDRTLSRFAEAFAACGFRRESFYPCYGLAEATLIAAGPRRQRGLSVRAKATQTPGQNALVGVGAALLSERLLIVNPETSVPVAAGAEGEIWLAGPNVANGYWERPEESARTFGAQLADGTGPFLRTGDLGILEEGELFVTGRIKDLIIVRGQNHYPQDIELTAEGAHQAVRRGCAASFALELDGEECLAVVAEVEKATEASELPRIAEAIRTAVIERHGVAPRVVALISRGSLAKTSSGKVQRGAMRQALLADELQALHVLRSAAPASEPEPSTERAALPGASELESLPFDERLALVRGWLRLWVARRTRVPASRVDCRAPFASFGLDSKDAVRLASEIEGWLGQPVQATVAYQYPSIDELSNWLARGRLDTLVAPAGAPAEPRPAPPSAELEAVAVVGLGCRVPGARGPSAFWRLLQDGVDAVQELPSWRWAVDDFYAPEPAPGKMYSKRAGTLDDVRRFDAEFFGISQREARSMDPQQRLLLEVAWEAVEDAGYAPEALRGSQTGVYLGICSNDYAQRHLRSGDLLRIDPYSGTGTAFSTAAGRVSYVLGLHGPSMAIDTACSSSLVAVHLACQSLRAGESSLALAGGVNLILSPESSVYLSTLGALSRDGRCKAFDANADGYVRGEGCGVVVLKLLRHALADGDVVLAVLRGSAVNQDGPSNGLTAPSAHAQQAVIRAALSQARLAPEHISYVEAHGTGTALGDPIELSALSAALGGPRTDGSKVLVGSVKANIGHLEAAAGVVGLIKTILALEHEKIPPLLHLRNPTPYVPWQQTPFELPRVALPWPRNGSPRRAGVSSFGLSGTNAHIVVEEAPPSTAPLAERGHELFLLSARSEAELVRHAAAHVAYLRARPDVPLAELCAASVARARLDQRALFVASSSEELREQLAAFAAGTGATAAAQLSRALADEPPVAFLFTGQGSQYAGMGRGLDDSEPVYRAAIDRCAAVLEGVLDRPLRAVLYPEPSDARVLDDTSYTQPALFALEYALVELWRSWGVKPRWLLGHSVGEYVAACVAGVLELPDALRLVATRGRLIKELARPGAMAAVAANEQRVHEAIGQQGSELAVAALNAPEHVVVSGSPSAVDRLVAKLSAQGTRCRMLDVSHAFHSPLMQPVVAELARVAEAIHHAPPSAGVRMISTVTGRLAETGELAQAGYWARQLREPVQFANALRALEDDGATLLVEVGPRTTLLALQREAVPGSRALRLASLDRSMPDRQRLLTTAGSLHAQGVELSFSAMAQAPRRALHLPAYPFAGEAHWLEPAQAPLQHVAAPPAPAAAAVVEAHGAEASAGVVERLRSLIAELLSTDARLVDVHAPLVDMGADSLILVEGLQRVEREFGVRVALREVFEGLSTLQALGEHVQRLARRDSSLRLSASAPQRRPANVTSVSGSVAEPAGYGERQRKHIQQLVERYQARTRSSKQRKAASTGLADPRSSVGYRASFPPALREQWLATKELCYPIVGARSEGARVWDIDGNEYVDFTMGFGVHLFGHGAPWLTAALEEQLRRGIQVGPQSELATAAGDRIRAMTGAERVAFCLSGSDAVMTALRIARAVVGRPKVAAFAGSYHGCFDGVLGVIPATHGSPPGFEQDLQVLEYGSPASLEAVRRHAHELSAVLVEPVQSRRPELQPADFLRELRALTREHGIALIFDEVLVGFRIAQGGAQAHFGVQADLVTYGKIVGGGLPIGVVAGKAELMNAVDGGSWTYGDASVPRVEPIWSAGTFNKNPLSMAACVAALTELERQGPGLQQGLNQRTELLVRRLNADFRAQGAPIEAVHFGSLFRLRMPRTLDLLFHHLIDRGVYVWEGRSMFLSSAHGDDEIERLVQATHASVEELRQGGFVPETEQAPRAAAPRTASPRIVSRPAPNPNARLSLYCFPYAGGGASAYRRWATELPSEVELCLVQLPGHDERRAESPLAEFEQLSTLLTRELAPTLREPFAFFGHSMGALLAHDVALRLAREHGLTPALLLVSGEPSPQLPPQPRGTPWHELDDDALLQLLVSHGAPPELARFDELAKEVLPLLRADLAVCASFCNGPGQHDCPIVAYNGADDPLATRAQVATWMDLTRDAFSLHSFPGDHFFVRSAQRPLLRSISRALLAALDGPAPAAASELARAPAARLVG